LEKERVKKMGLFLDYSLDKQAVMEIQSVHPASILQADPMALYHELFIPKVFKSLVDEGSHSFIYAERKCAENYYK